MEFEKFTHNLHYATVNNGTKINPWNYRCPCKMVPKHFTYSFIFGTIIAPGKLGQPFILVPFEVFMLVKFDVPDSEAQLVMSITSKNVASKAYISAAQSYSLLRAIVDDLNKTIDQQRARILHLESVIDHARSAALDLAEHVSHQDLPSEPFDYRNV